MSRVAKYPVNVPKGVEVNLQAQEITIKSSKGEMHHSIHPTVQVEFNDNALVFTAKDDSKAANAFAGTTRALLNNMVKGLSQGFERKLTLVGVGYRAQIQDNVLNLSLGFSHPVDFPIPDGVTIEAPSQTEIIVKGADKQQVGQVAANIRNFRPPEPYKGKGVRYADETIMMKEAKKK